MRVSMMMLAVFAACVTVAIGCGPDAPEPQADAGSVAAASSGAEGGEALACDDNTCGVACWYACEAPSGTCIAIEGEPRACLCDCK